MNTNVESVINHDQLISLGFEHEGGSILNAYSRNISYYPEKEYKRITVTLNPGNIYVYLRQGELSSARHFDDVICIFNQDLQGTLVKSWLENLIGLLTI